MRKLLITMLIALVVPAAASAHGRHHHHHALLARLSGSGTLASSSGTMASAKLGNGTFTATVATTGAATTRTGEHGTLSCAPATATLALVGTTTTNATLTGKSCTWTPAGSTAATSMFFGRNATTHMKAFLVRKADATVKGAVFAGFDRHLLTQFSALQRHDCDRNDD